MHNKDNLTHINLVNKLSLLVLSKTLLNNLHRYKFLERLPS